MESNICTSGVATSGNMIFYDHEWNKFQQLKKIMFLLR